MTIFTFLALFAGFGFTALEEDYNQATNLVVGVFVGSAIWWLILSEGVTLFRKRVSQKVMIWINRIAGLIIAGFGVAALVSISV